MTIHVEYHPAHHGRLLSASRPISGMRPQQFLQGAEGQERFFWRDGGRGTTFAGMGVAAHLLGYGQNRFTAIQRQAHALFTHADLQPGQPALAAPRLFGGFSFREEFVPDVTWTGFHPAHFILPHYQLATRNDQSWLTINALLPPAEEAPASLHLLQEALSAVASGQWPVANTAPQVTGPQTTAIEIDYPLRTHEWAQMIHKAQQAFATTALQKVVLSRIAQVRTAKPIGILPALTHLLTHYPDCFSFLFEPQPGHAFFGATPELLVRVQGAQLETMALAGSIQRGGTWEEDRCLADTLLGSAKDRHEQRLVVDALRHRLQPLTSQLSIPHEPAVLTLSNIQHLYTPVRGTLSRPQGVLSLVKELHPTPALGGWPRELALAFIQAHEPTLRGWYAGPVGWIDSSLDGAFAVAIRSAVVQKRRAWAYAGAGIVADSIPEKEWLETEWKFQAIVRAIASESKPSCRGNSQ